MSTRERGWTAIVSIASSHAGLNPHFKALEDALYACLSEIDDPRSVRAWLEDTVRVLRGERLRLIALRHAVGRPSPSARALRKRRT